MVSITDKVAGGLPDADPPSGAGPAPTAWAQGPPVAAFPARARLIGAAYAAATLPVAVAVGATASGPAEYLSGWVRASALLSYPALGASLLAARRSLPAGDGSFWRWWSAAVAVALVNGTALAIVADHDVLGLRALAIPAVVVNTLLFIVANLSFMRSRSGGRSLLLDVVETASATVILVAVLALVLGERLLASTAQWFTVPCIIALIGGVIGLVWAITLLSRAPPGQRRIELLAVGLGVLTVADAIAQLAQGLSGFTLPGAPLLLVQQLTMAALFLVPLHASRVHLPGLERFSPQEQVRGSRALTVLTLVAVPVMGVLALVVQGGSYLAVVYVAANALALAMLLALRTLLALDETKRLYQRVAEAAEERQRLVQALARRGEDDRHRFAAQLHQQAIASYATFASFVETASLASPSGVGPLPETSERIRADLGRQAEVWRAFMLAVRPPGAGAGTAAGLATAIRAQVVGLFGNHPVPSLTVRVDPVLHLDWATEALVLRITQEIITELTRRVLATRLTVELSATSAGTELRLTHDVPRTAAHPEATEGAAGLPTVEPFVALGGGGLHVEDVPGGGTVVVVRLGSMNRPLATAPRRPRLRVVRQPS